ncbi:MAG: PKD domain-containing protein [Candidatus Omnitrophica bacterium]|nr:PKD domain-containing protein [Candidatus Omnitrophota bacterium]
MGFKFIVGIFRTPFRLADDYQYNHDPKYREQVEKQEDKEYQAERERLKDLKEKLKAYIDEDLKKESPGPKKPLIEEPKFPQGESTLPQEQAVGATTPAVTAAIVEKPAEVKPLIEARPDEVKAQPEIKLTETTALPVEEPAIVIPVVTPASVEEKPVEVETQPVEKLAEAKPSLEVEPAETKPQVEVNKEVSKPEDKPAEVILPPQAVEEPVKPKEEPIVAAPIPQTPKPEISYPNPQPVIIAKPVKGPSPLKVNFYGYKSTSPNGKVVSYLWDFGDGDTSTKKNPTNTYWSATYGARSFTVSLTVKDDKGATATSRIVIEVGNK